MRADRAIAPRRLAAVSASVLVAVLLVSGCRTVVDPQGDLDRALKAVVQAAEAKEIAALPEGPTKALVTERCLLCHGAALITQQHKDAAAWGRTVTQMRTWGTPIQDQDQTALIAYFVEHFGKR